MTYNHLLQVLLKCFLDDKYQPIYAGRWDVWMIQNGHMYEYLHMLRKTDDQLGQILAHARYLAASPLVKALK